MAKEKRSKDFIDEYVTDCKQKSVKMQGKDLWIK